jgi:hypothetical protein
MIFHGSRQLDQLLVRLLARKPRQSAKSLHQQILRAGRDCSIQGVYHELRKLQRLGNIVKVNEYYSLSFLWIEDLANIAYMVQRRYVRNLAALLELPEPGKRKRWRFFDLRRMDAMYVQLTLALRRQEGKAPSYEWCPNAWFTLVQEDIEKQFKSAMHASQAPLYVILGGTSTIESEWVKTRVSPIIHYARADYSFRSEGNSYVTVIGPYVIKAEIPRELAKKVRKILHESETVAQGNLKLNKLLMSRRWSCSVSATHNERMATRIRKRYARFFD